MNCEASGSVPQTGTKEHGQLNRLAQELRPAVPAPNFPGLIPPALASPIERVPNGERWIHEIKFDGYRVQVHFVEKM
jgi:ATP-dependent DNA ligase